MTYYLIFILTLVNGITAVEPAGYTTSPEACVAGVGLLASALKDNEMAICVRTEEPIDG